MANSITTTIATAAKGFTLLLLGMLAIGATTVHALELRDPTKPGWSPPNPDASATVNKPARRLLTAIVIGDNKRLALIGENYYRVGDRVGDAKLTKIAFDYVVLNGGDGERILRLTPLLDSRPTAAKANGS